MQLPLSLRIDTWTQPLLRVLRSFLVVTAGLLAYGGTALAQSSASWNSVGPPGGTVVSILKSPRSESVLYVGTAQNGVFMSADGGQTWSATNAGLPTTVGSSWRTVRALASDGQYLYAATEAGLFYAAVGAAASDLPSWSALTGPAGLATSALMAFDPSSGSLFVTAATATVGAVPVVHRMAVPPLGAAPAGSWVASPLPANTIDTAVGAMGVIPASGANPGGLLVGAANRLFVASVVAGGAALNWTDADPAATFFAAGAIEALHFSADFSQAYACSAGQLFVATDPLTPALNAWLPAQVSPAPAMAFACAAIDSGGLAGGAAPVVAVATSAGLYLSRDGTTFNPASAFDASLAANAVAIAGIGAPALYAATGFGVASQSLSSLTSTSAWTVVNGPGSVSGGGPNGRLNNANVIDSVVIGSSLFAAVVSEQFADVLRSNDAGATWTPTRLNGVAGELVGINALAADPTNGIVYAATGNGLFALSTTAGNWVAVSAATVSITNALVRGAAAMYLGTDVGIFSLPLSASPSNATAAPAGLDGLRVSALQIADGKVYAGTFDFNSGLASVVVATDGSGAARNWVDFATGPVGSNRVLSIAAVGTSLLAATRGGLVRVAAPGGAWTSANTSASPTEWVSDPNGVVTALFSDGSMVYAATGNNGIFASPVGATFTWAPFNGTSGQDLPALEVHQLRGVGTAIYAATAAGLAVINGGAGTAPPGPATSSDGGGGGSLDLASLLGLALLVRLLTASTRARRSRRVAAGAPSPTPPAIRQNPYQGPSRDNCCFQMDVNTLRP